MPSVKTKSAKFVIADPADDLKILYAGGRFAVYYNLQINGVGKSWPGRRAKLCFEKPIEFTTVKGLVPVESETPGTVFTIQRERAEIVDLVLPQGKDLACELQIKQTSGRKNAEVDLYLERNMVRLGKQDYAVGTYTRQVGGISLFV